MMPYCSWKRCKSVGDRKLELGLDFIHPYLCKKHWSKLLKKVNVMEPENDA
jgi:hypothetical protein